MDNRLRIYFSQETGQGKETRSAAKEASRQPPRCSCGGTMFVYENPHRGPELVCDRCDRFTITVNPIY
jgi:hypothetical protein